MNNLSKVLALGLILFSGACSVTEMTSAEYVALAEQKLLEQKAQDDTFKATIGKHIYVYCSETTTSIANNIGSFNATHTEYIPKNASGATIAKFSVSTSTTTATYISTETDAVVYTITLGSGTPKKGVLKIETTTTDLWFSDLNPE